MAGGLNQVRQWRRPVSWLLMLGLLLPLITGLAAGGGPLKAEAALARDLQVSLCMAAGQPDSQPKSPVHRDQACVFCAAGCTVCAPALSAQAGSGLDVPAVLSAWTAEDQTDDRTFGHRRAAHVPRGPPLSA